MATSPASAFWRRSAAKGPGGVRAVGQAARGRQPSFTEVDDYNDAWSDGEDELVQSLGSLSAAARPAAPPQQQQQQQPAATAASVAVAAPRPGSAVSASTPVSATVASSPPQSPITAATVGHQPGTPPSPAVDEDAAAGGRVPRQRPPPKIVPLPSSQLKSKDELRLEKFGRLLSSPSLNLEALRELSWSGIPSNIRPTVWQLLAGYLPANLGRRQSTLERKREEYRGFVEQYYHTRHEGGNRRDFHQIEIDVPRTSPAVGIFDQRIVQAILERILYIWAIRHPGSGYVQGMNDLVTPFLAVFFSPYIDCDISECDLSTVPQEIRDTVEADCFWCFSKLLDGIQDNYTASQPGIQSKVRAMEGLVTRIDGALADHLKQHGLEYMQFAFRWMNCMLMRELPHHCIIRLWDTYLSESDGFATFHVYVCAAFLKTFSENLRALTDFQPLLIQLQNLPTTTWTDREIELLLAEAYRLKYMFHQSQQHLKPT